MKKIRNIVLCFIALFALIVLTSCNKNNSSNGNNPGENNPNNNPEETVVNEYSVDLDILYTSEEPITVDSFIKECEEKYSISLEGQMFNVSCEDSLVLTKTDNNFAINDIGSTTITLENESNKIAVNVNVKPEIKVLAFNSMKQGNSQSVSVKFKPETAKEEYEITSSNPEIISVNSTNKLKAESHGTATITVKTASGFEYSLDITVEEVVYKITYEVSDEYLEYVDGDFPTEYKNSDLPIVLPTFDCPGYAFFGWQINPVADDYTVENLVTVVPEGTKGNLVLRVIIERSRLELRFENTSAIEPGQTLGVDFELINVPEAMQEIVWESRNTNIASVDSDGVVTGITNGVAEIFAYLKHMPEVNMSICVSIDENLNKTGELLDYLKSIAINEIVTKKITVVAYQGNYTTYMYSGVSLYLFEDLNIVEQMTSLSQSNRPGDIYKKHYITVHDTASGAESANAKSHANYVNQGGGGTSWHYSVGNDGIYHQIPDNEKAHHAGDGTRPYELYDSGVTGTNKYPVVTISTDGYYVLDGAKTKVAAPKIESNGASRIAKTEDINDFGIRVVLQDGKYYIGKTYFNDTYDKISNGGGNCNAIGIEMCVNKNSDIYYTWQKNAKLVAKLLYDNNLTIDDVKPHHFFSGKDCPATMLHADMWDMFIDMVEVEYKIRSEYAGYKISISSDNEDFIGSNGKVLKQAPLSRSVTYTITVEKDGIKESVTLSTVIPGRLATNQK